MLTNARRSERPKIRRIGISTGGGDAPGLNAVIRAAVKSALNLGWEIVGIRRGFDGLFLPGMAKKLTAHDVAGILNMGGTILGTTNRGNPFEYRVKVGKKTVVKDVSGTILQRVRALGLDAIVVIGGDGTLAIAKRLSEMGVPVVGVPKTIDNDMPGTVVTFGYDTAVSTATDALDKLHSTAASHQRTMVVEVMGRYAGWIALNSGVAGSADVILIPEIPFDMDIVCQKVEDRYHRKRNFAIVVAAEGAKPAGGKMFTREHHDAARQEVLLGGVAQYVADEIAKRTGRETRSLVPGHLQRGGQPTTFDRLLGTRFGAAAIRLIAEGGFGRMVCLRPPSIDSVPLAEVAIGKPRLVPLESDTILSARALGISFGDRPS
ncbi:MAG TPA: ATP-dependent 6-phosphofructokinase [Candidatus Acidoferrum sp.]|nr:ATP-dependent 6-phosphofructokinase [Candidatus Acidoferrum sp.]